MFYENWIHYFAPGKDQEAIDLLRRWSTHHESKGYKPLRVLRPEWGKTNRLYVVVEWQSRAQLDKLSWDETDQAFVKEFRESGVFLPSETEHYCLHEPE